MRYCRRWIVPGTRAEMILQHGQMLSYYATPTVSRIDPWFERAIYARLTQKVEQTAVALLYSVGRQCGMDTSFRQRPRRGSPAHFERHTQTHARGIAVNTEEIVEVFRRWMNGETREYLSMDGKWYPVMDHDYSWNAATDYRIRPKPLEPREWWIELDIPNYNGRLASDTLRAGSHCT